MPPLWDADIHLTQAEATQLIEHQFPELAPARLEPLGTGWDNTAYVVNGQWVFRFPRRKLMVGLLESELRLLPRLAPHLPLPIPIPVWKGQPEEHFPYPFAGYAMLPGQTADRVAWTTEERTRTAVPLAQFLAALHGIPVDAEALAAGPRDELERTNLKKWLPLIRERLAAVESQLPEVDLAKVREQVERLADTAPWNKRPCWVHGDLYARHLLVDSGHQLTGVLDWGDVHLGDPALDLSIVFSFLPPGARKDFHAAYGAIDEATWARARFRAFQYGGALVQYGQSTGDAAIAQVGRDALHLALQG